MKNYLCILIVVLGFLSCESSVKADFDTIKTKNLILIGEDGKEYLLKVVNDSTGNPVLKIENYHP